MEPDRGRLARAGGFRAKRPRGFLYASAAKLMQKSWCVASRRVRRAPDEY
jgi:hypothetical protein